MSKTMSVSGVRGVLLAGAAAVLLGGCSTNPTTGRSQFNALSRDQEIALGTEAMPQLTAEFGGAVARQDLQAYVREIGLKLAQHTEGESPSLPWEFTLLDSDVINAFALPGGKVFVSRGLAEKMTSEAQLAGVLGHEIGHVTARHVNDRIAQQQGFQIGGALLGILVGDSGGGQALSELYGFGGQGFLLKFSRDQESESDALGMRYMAKAGYDPAGQRGVMEILQASMGGASGQGEFFATHPYPETRIKRITQLLETEYAYTQNNPQFKKGEAEFRQRFLSKLRAAYPADRPANEDDHRLALASLRMPSFVNCGR